MNKNFDITFNELPEAISQLMKDVNELRSLLQTVHDAKVEPDRWFNIDQLCQYIPDKPAKQTVYGWVSHHTIPYHKKGKKLQFLKSEIDQWLKSDQRKTAAELHAEAIAYVNSKKGGLR